MLQGRSNFGMAAGFIARWNEGPSSGSPRVREIRRGQRHRDVYQMWEGSHKEETTTQEPGVRQGYPTVSGLNSEDPDPRSAYGVE